LAIHGELTPSTDCEGCDDFAFAHWLKAHGGVAIVAHPGGPPPAGDEILDTSTKRSPGWSDSFVHGLALANCVPYCPEQTFLNDSALVTWTWHGFRLFPAATSDIHHFRADKYSASCGEGDTLTGISGAAVCWVPDTFPLLQQPGERRQLVLEAMRLRRCYASQPYFPRLKLELCTNWNTSTSTCIGSKVAMGAAVPALASTTVQVVAFASRDPNPTHTHPALSRVELIGINRSLEPYGSSLLTSADCPGEVCNLAYPFQPPTGAGGSVVPYAVYAQVVTVPGGSQPTRAISAPIFLNWVSADGCPADAPDFDEDFVPDCLDNCPLIANGSQADSEKTPDGFGLIPDRLGDACDVDSDGDGFCDPGANQAACNDNREIINANPLTLGPPKDPPDIPVANCAVGTGGCVGTDLCPDKPDDDCGGGSPCDSDMDGVPDACDLCPHIDSQGTADADDDGVGDLCDNCKYIPNPRSLDPTYGPWASVAARTAVGGQLDDDADGFGNACDLDLDGDRYTEACERDIVGESTFEPVDAQCPVPVPPDPECGVPAVVPCSIHDLNERDSQVDGLDVSRAIFLLANHSDLNSPPASCCIKPPFPLVPNCTASDCGDCVGSKCDDGDGIPNDGADEGSVVGDTLCVNATSGCDDNCPRVANPTQEVGLGPIIGEACRCGDVNTDGTVNVSDIIGANTCIYNPQTTQFDCTRCDVNNDGRCDVQDLTRMNSAIYESCIPVCKLYPEGTALPGVKAPPVPPTCDLL
jgi:hypothetical protein